MQQYFVQGAAVTLCLATVIQVDSFEDLFCSLGVLFLWFLQDPSGKLLLHPDFQWCL